VALAGISQTPGLSNVFGSRPLGPIGWATAVGASAAATGASVILPDLVERFRAQARSPVVVVPEPPALGSSPAPGD
jgi:hypothetical protein